MKAVLVRMDEGTWEGLYIDGEMKMQGHSLDALDILEALGIDCESRRVERYMSHFPSDLEDLNDWKQL